MKRLIEQVKRRTNRMEEQRRCTGTLDSRQGEQRQGQWMERTNVTNHVEMRNVLQKSLFSKQRSKSRPGQYIVNMCVKIDFRFFAFLERLSIKESPVQRNFSSDVCKSWKIGDFLSVSVRCFPENREILPAGGPVMSKSIRFRSRFSSS